MRAAQLPSRTFRVGVPVLPAGSGGVTHVALAGPLRR